MPPIWIFTELYYPEQTSTGYFLTKTAEGLSEEFEVKVITGPATNFFQKANCPAYEVVNKVAIFRCKGTNFNKNFIIGRCINSLSRSVAILIKGLFLCQPQSTLLVVTNPPLLPFVALLLKSLKSCQLVLLIHDIYPEALVASGLLKSSSPLVRLGEKLNLLLYEESSRIITLGRDMTKLVQGKLSSNHNKIHCISYWAENEIVRPTERSENVLLQDLGIKDRFVVLYTGNMGRTHGIEDLANATKRIENKNIHFLVIGCGAKKKWLEQYVKGHNIKNVSIIPLELRPRSEQIISLNAGDLALIPFVPRMAGISVPSRMYNHMAAGKPIIAVTDECSELAKVVREEEIGWVVSPGNIEELVNTIEYAAEHPDICLKMGFRAAAVAQTKYTFNQTDRAYKKLFRELI